MEDWFLKELKEKGLEVSLIKDAKERSAGNQMLVNTVVALAQLSNRAWTKDEDIFCALTRLPRFKNRWLLEDLVRLIKEGYPDKILNGIAAQWYFTSAPQGYMALQYLMIMTGVQLIRRHELKTAAVIEILLSGTPEDTRKLYKKSVTTKISAKKSGKSGKTSKKKEDEWLFEVKFTEDKDGQMACNFSGNPDEVPYPEMLKKTKTPVAKKDIKKEKVSRGKTTAPVVEPDTGNLKDTTKRLNEYVERNKKTAKTTKKATLSTIISPVSEETKREIEEAKKKPVVVPEKLTRGRKPKSTKKEETPAVKEEPLETAPAEGFNTAYWMTVNAQITKLEKFLMSRKWTDQKDLETALYHYYSKCRGIMEQQDALVKLTNVFRGIKCEGIEGLSEAAKKTVLITVEDELREDGYTSTLKDVDLVMLLNMSDKEIKECGYEVAVKRETDKNSKDNSVEKAVEHNRYIIDCLKRNRKGECITNQDIDDIIDLGGAEEVNKRIKAIKNAAAKLGKTVYSLTDSELKKLCSRMSTLRKK